MPARTLGQAIDRLLDILPDAIPPLLSEAARDLKDARARLDGLEESRALTDARTHAYERATVLVERVAGTNALTKPSLLEKVLEVAQFLSAGWEELEGPDGLERDLGPLATREDLAEDEASALARVDELENLLERKEAKLEALTAEVERLRNADLDAGVTETIRKLNEDFAAEHAENLELRGALEAAQADKDLALTRIREHVETIDKLRREVAELRA